MASMKDVGALLMAVPASTKKKDEDGESMEGDDATPRSIARDGARMLMDAIRGDDADGIVDAFRVLTRACPMMEDEDDEEAEETAKRKEA